ncbi:MAG: ABC transporter substrate-binding protein [Aminobacterium sp.]|uniref:ABC transporter substrate-binding protein n=1 Tax=Aminobacterium sp. TaxID=1872491 RepID=UPI001BCB93E9|nr:ABC transporter substrate-binding protein [Aminobacterium sp.]MDD2206241.1 ABC transporter substrate-binding protein [Aminobacterium sp.]MDD3707564.1 ABC transporter substrate-binding protein [Aminobacterium sp.]MDD4229316.1 ABC transporter substrate-binding protein [Aminobacterium sp.]MDD4552180.1 ABC transporter substrate-binding protein [Aminobacterium sp.]MEA4877058.1 ABC transporter substrate-binding protein [Aminobacterium sp.]
MHISGLKKTLCVSCLAVILSMVLILPGIAGDIPRLNVSYIFTTHLEPFMVAMSKEENFKELGTWLKPVVSKEKYDLMVDGKAVARLNIIVAKSGSETAVLFAQKHLDIGMGSLPAMMSAVDNNTPIKVLCPIHTDGMGVVVSKKSPINTWEDFLAYVAKNEKPVKLGYHSPTSAPRIVVEGALNDAGLTLTQDANNMDADILLVDLKSTSNLIPALMSQQVDAWVGPAPFPEVAEVQDVGKTIIDLRNLPPTGKWSHFPCCVAAARDEILAAHPEEVKAFTTLLTQSAKWCNDHKNEAGKIAANWIGIPEEAAAKSTIVYTTDPSEGWMRGAQTYLSVLNGMNKFKGQLKGKAMDDVQSLIFDFSYVK